MDTSSRTQLSSSRASSGTFTECTCISGTWIGMLALLCGLTLLNCTPNPNQRVGGEDDNSQIGSGDENDDEGNANGTSDAYVSNGGDGSKGTNPGPDTSRGSDDTTSKGPTLTLASWNLEAPSWDETKTQTAPLRKTARALDADVIALQEIGPEPRLDEIFDTNRYETYVSDQRDANLRNGFAVDSQLRATSREPLDTQIRESTVLSITFQSTQIYLLSAHFASGCQQGPSASNSEQYACRTTREQSETLQSWIEAREAEGDYYVVMGDFNRVYEEDTAFWQNIEAADDNLRITSKGSNLNPECINPRTFDQFIDHILVDGDLEEEMEISAFRELLYYDVLQENVSSDEASDHCPVSIRLTPK